MSGPFGLSSEEKECDDKGGALSLADLTCPDPDEEDGFPGLPICWPFEVEGIGVGAGEALALSGAAGPEISLPSALASFLASLAATASETILVVPSGIFIGTLGLFTLPALRPPCLPGAFDPEGPAVDDVPVALPLLLLLFDNLLS